MKISFQNDTRQITVHIGDHMHTESLPPRDHMPNTPEGAYRLLKAITDRAKASVGNG